MPTSNKKSGSGNSCFLYGCLSLVVLAIVVLLGGYLTVRYVVNTAIENFTDDAPIEFEQVVLSETEQADLKKRVETFNAAKGKTNQPVELTLTSDEINALVQDQEKPPELSAVQIQIEDNQLVARASIPLARFSSMPFMSRLKERHLNADVRLDVSLEDGVATIEVASAEVNGEPLPPEIIDELRQEGALDEALNDPKIREQLNKLDSIKIENGQLKITTGGGSQAQQ